MSILSEYARTIIGVSVISGIISVIAPSGANNKVFRFVCGLFVLLCLIRPLNDSVNALKNIEFDFGDDYTFTQTENYTYKLIENEMKSQLNICVKQVTGQSAKDISVIVVGDNENINIGSVTITLESAYIHKAKALEEFIFSKFGVKASVIT